MVSKKSDKTTRSYPTKRDEENESEANTQNIWEDLKAAALCVHCTWYRLLGLVCLTLNVDVNIEGIPYDVSKVLLCSHTVEVLT